MFIDLHNHIVFGVDDGPVDFGTSVQMLKDAVSKGTEKIVATPHVLPGYQYFDYSRYFQNLHLLQEYCENEKLDVEIYQGAEVFFTDSTGRFLTEGRIPTLANSDCILLEFSGDARYDALQRAANIVSGEGYTPVFAHIERYQCLKNIKHVERLCDEYGVLMQMNAGTVVRANRFLSSGHWVWSALKHGLISFIASDAHNLTTRTVDLSNCAAILDKKFGIEYRSQLMMENQKDILHI